MFRSIATALALSASIAEAQDLDITDTVSQGLAHAESVLTAPDPATRFALGGVRFLRGIERSLQKRYRHNAQFEGLDLPILRLPVPPNPAPRPMHPGLITDIFRDLLRDVNAARFELTRIEGDFGVVVDLNALWFDIDEDGQRDEGEGVIAAAAASLIARPRDTALDGTVGALEVRFDAADALWLRAYTGLLSSIGNLVLAFDPTPVIGRINSSNRRMTALRGMPHSNGLFLGPDDERFADLFSIIYGAINRKPDARRIGFARDFALSVVEDNRAFWQTVAQETDNDREWLPNATQTSALGVDLPPETATTWLSVLDDAEKILKGELLIGHWRVAPGAGINVAKLLDDPPAVDIVTWFHGSGLVGFMERGPLASTDNLRRMEQLFGGNALLFMVWLN